MHRSLRAAALIGVSTLALAAAEPPPANNYAAHAAAAKEYAVKATALYKTEGQEATRKAFMTRKAWVTGADQNNLHVTGLADENEMVWADSGFPEVVGMNFHDLSDLDGASLGDMVWSGLAKSPDGAAMQGRFNDVVTKSVIHFEGYCLRADAKNVICAWSQAPL